jgi:hypothetical protein
MYFSLSKYMKSICNILRNECYFDFLVAFLNFKPCRVSEGFISYDAVITSCIPTFSYSTFLYSFFQNNVSVVI